MVTDLARPQDVERKHVRRAKPSRATQDLLGRYQAQMRYDLDMLVRMLRSDTLAVAEREKFGNLAIKLARELGSEVEGPKHPAKVMPLATRREVEF
jgi:hypothetical protein